jgi:hypothetical protein
VDKKERSMGAAERDEQARQEWRGRVRAPRNAVENITLIALMTSSGLGAAMTLSGATDRAASGAIDGHDRA